MAGPPPFARLFTAAPEGQNEDNGALLELVLCALPPDKIQTAAAAARPLAAMASLAVPPEACGLPIMYYGGTGRARPRGQTPPASSLATAIWPPCSGHTRSAVRCL